MIPMSQEQGTFSVITNITMNSKSKREQWIVTLPVPGTVGMYATTLMKLLESLYVTDLQFWKYIWEIGP